MSDERSPGSLASESRKPRPGWALIASERERQEHHEGWTPEHDDEHGTGELVEAALAYATHAHDQVTGGVHDEDDYLLPTPPWPWHMDWWKPSDDPIRNLVKAGALIAAEIDRLQRANIARSGDDSDA